MTQSTYHVSVYMLNTTSHTREELVRQELWLRQVKVAIACPWNANFTKWDHHSPYDLVHAIAFERCSGGGKQKKTVLPKAGDDQGSSPSQ